MDEKPFESMNMIPFIDIMLVLLTIVLTTSSFIASGRIPLNLPQASDESTETPELEIIEIDSRGGIRHSWGPVSLEQLDERLAGLNRDSPLLLRADKTIQLQRFVDVADALKQLNFHKVAVQTEVIAK